MRKLLLVTSMLAGSLLFGSAANALEVKLDCKFGATIEVETTFATTGTGIGQLYYTATPTSVSAVCHPEGSTGNTYIMRNWPGKPMFGSVDDMMKFMEYVGTKGGELQHGKAKPAS